VVKYSLRTSSLHNNRKKQTIAENGIFNTTSIEQNGLFVVIQKEITVDNLPT